MYTNYRHTHFPPPAYTLIGWSLLEHRYTEPIVSVENLEVISCLLNRLMYNEVEHLPLYIKDKIRKLGPLENYLFFII